MKRYFVFLLVLALFQGCAWFEKDAEKSAKELVKEGMDAYNDEDYLESIESFEKVKDWYPFSKYAVLAELKIADAYYKTEQYEDAILAYEEFENLHPRNEAIPQVIYRIGRCYFDRISTIDRDQKSTRKALDTFNRLIKRFPKNGMSYKAAVHVRECRNNLAEHEFYVGMFYFKSMHYKAALHRFANLARDYPDTAVRSKARQYINICKNRMKEDESKD